jgi:hypothetical protein
LNSHFNDAYQTLAEDISKRLQRIASLEEARSKVQAPKKTEIYEHLAAKLEGELRTLDGLLVNITTALDFLSKKLNEKQRAPFESLPIAESAPPLDPTVIERINVIIDQHNAHSDSFAKEIKKAREEIECSNVAAVVDKYNELVTAGKVASTAVESTQVPSATRGVIRTGRSVACISGRSSTAG